MKKLKQSASPAVHVLKSSVTEEKMRAIAAVASAIHELAKAINSTNLTANISNCTFTGETAGIQLEGQ